MRLTAVLGILLAFSLACGYTKGENPKLDAFVEDFCAKVNDENWHSVNMGGKPSREYCEQQARYWYGGAPVRPCNVGGLARFCLENENGLMVFGPQQAYLLTVYPEDLPRVRPHLEWF